MISWHGFQWGLGIFDNSPCEPAYPYNYKVWWCSSSQQCNNSDSSTVTALSCTIGGRQTSTTDMLQALFYNYLIWSVRSHCFHSKDYCLFRGTEKLNNTWVLNDLLWPAIPRALQFICRKCTQIRPFICVSIQSYTDYWGWQSLPLPQAFCAYRRAFCLYVHSKELAISLINLSFRLNDPD